MNDMPKSNAVSNFRITLIITQAVISSKHARTHRRTHNTYRQFWRLALQRGTESKRLKPLTVWPPMRFSWQGAHENHLEKL